MRKSEKIFNFEMEEREGKVLLTAKEWPYSVLQVVPATPETFDEVVRNQKEGYGGGAGTKESGIVCNNLFRCH